MARTETSPWRTAFRLSAAKPQGPIRSRPFGFPLLVVLLTWGIPFASSAGGGSISEVLTQRATGFVAGLDEKQRGKGTYAFDDGERFDLRLAPLGLEGLRVDQMKEAQWTELEALMAGVLSPAGLRKMNTIRSLEHEVAEMEGGLFGFVMNWIRDPERYFLAIFGEPKRETPWGMRFDGHHVSLNWTVVPGEALSVTPLFLGGQPRVVPDGLERAGLRVLVDEEDRALGLINAFSKDERALARIPFDDGGAFSRPMSVVEGERVDPQQPVGQPARSMSRDSRGRLNGVIETVLENFVPEIASHYRTGLSTEANTIHFAYAIPEDRAGMPLQPGTPLYYRIQGASFLIEYDNTSEEADHIHLVWREFTGDFGRDVLAEHHKRHH